MAEKYPFAEDPTGPQEEPDQGVLHNIATYLQDPKLGPAIANVGFQMAAGGQWGDTTMSRLARGFAAGGAGIRQAETQELKEREVASKEDLRAAQATAAEARAGAAGARAGEAGSRAELAMGRLQLAQQALDYKKEIDARRLEATERDKYFRYVDAATKRNVLATSPEPLLPYDQWKAKGSPGGGDVTGPSAAASGTLRQDPDAIGQAKAAIKSGKDPEAVKGYLRSQGIDPTGL